MLLGILRCSVAIISMLTCANSSQAESGDIFELGSLYGCIVEQSNLAIVGTPQADGYANRVVPATDGVGKSFSIYRTFCEFTGTTTLTCPKESRAGTEFLIVQDDAGEFSEAFQKTGEGRYRGHANLTALLIDGTKVTYIRSGIGNDEADIDALVWVDRTRCFLIGKSPYRDN